MQIFLPFSSFVKSAACLDKERLDRQITNIGKLLVRIDSVEVEDNRDDLFLLEQGWSGFEASLAWFGMLAINSWGSRFPESSERRTRQMTWLKNRLSEEASDGTNPPAWVENKDIMRSHRSNLIRKMPARYAEMFPGTPENMPIIYPQVIRDGSYRLRLNNADIARLDSGERKLPEHLSFDHNKREVVRDEH